MTRQQAATKPKPRRTLSAFARALLREWRNLKLATTGATIIVAVSGGADSVALLLALDELVKSGKLSLRLCVAHLNHKLRPESHADARWVARLAKQLDHKSSVGSVEVKTLAKTTGDHLEQAARRARYEFRTDEMNNDEAFARVRVRTQLLPLMQSFNPKLVEALARTAEVLREDNHALESAAGRLFELSIATNEDSGAGGKDCPSLRTDL